MENIEIFQYFGDIQHICGTWKWYSRAFSFVSGVNRTFIYLILPFTNHMSKKKKVDRISIKWCFFHIFRIFKSRWRLEKLVYGSKIFHTLFSHQGATFFTITRTNSKKLKKRSTIIYIWRYNSLFCEYYSCRKLYSRIY